MSDTLRRMNEHRPLLELREARVVREGRTILDIDRFVVNQGEHIAILGPNGSGKSTLIGVLVRDVRPLHIEGRPAVRLLGHERWELVRARELFGVVSSSWQDRFMRHITVRDTVQSGYFGSVGVHPSTQPSEAQIARADDLIHTLGIGHLAQRYMDTLSTGEARRALIARALVSDPPVLVLDEPCAGLDPGAAYRMRETYGSLAGSGRSLMLVTHHVEDIGPEIDRAVLMQDGSIVADGPVAEVLDSARLGELFGVVVELECRGGRYRLA